MATTTANDDLDIPRQARRFLDDVQSQESDIRTQIKLRLEMYAGQGLQWDAKERARRIAARRPMLEINECKPPVDQIETDIRVNPPGPICHPVGAGATAETADVIAGIIRQILYASNGNRCGITAGKHSAISGYGVLEYGTRYVDDDSLDQELYMIDNEDPSVWYFDPLARLPNREDALVALKGPRILSADAYVEAYGKKRKVLDRGFIQRFAGNVQGMFGWSGDYATANMWSGGGKGPYWVAEFWKVGIKLRKKRMYSDNIFRFEDDVKKHGLPEGVTVKTDPDGDDTGYVRYVPVRKVTKYVVDACEVLDQTEWIGDHIPAIAILGPEIYIEGKLYRGSLVAGMIDPQKALNYVATSMVEIAGKVPRAPYIGTKGQFEDLGDDGVNKWATATTEDHAWLAVEPVSIVDETTGRTTLAPLPQRNMMEASIQWLLGLAGFFKDAIQAASAYSATSLGKRTADQSGEAIRALQAESAKGTFSYPDGLNSGYAVMFQQWLGIIPKIMDSARVQTVIAADGQNEQKLINAEFPHPDGGKNEDGTPKTMAHHLGLGRYSVRVDAGPSTTERNSQAETTLGNVFKAAPQLLGIPGVAAAYTRMVGDGNPRVDQIADLLPGGDTANANPAALQGQLAQAKQQIQQLTVELTQAKQASDAKLPQVAANERNNVRDNLTRLAVAEVSASKDADNARAEREADLLAQQLDMAHDAGMQAQDQEHQANQQQSAQDAQAQQQQQQPAQPEGTNS